MFLRDFVLGSSEDEVTHLTPATNALDFNAFTYFSPADSDILAHLLLKYF